MYDALLAAMRLKCAKHRGLLQCTCGSSDGLRTCHGALEHADAPQDDAAREVAHVQAAGHLLEVVLPRVVAGRVQLPVLLQPRQHV